MEIDRSRARGVAREKTVEQQTIEEAEQIGREILRATTRDLAILVFRVSLFAGAVALLLPVVLTAGSVWAYSTGDVAYRSALGLLWLLSCLVGYGACLYLAGLNQTDWEILAKFEGFSGWWQEGWKDWIELFLRIQRVPLEQKQFAAVVKGMAEELATWSEHGGKWLVWLGSALRKFIYKWCFATIAALSAVARFAADLHLGKADTQIGETFRLLGLLNKELTVSVVISTAFFFYGIAADFRRSAALRIKEEKQAAEALQRARSSGKTVLFLSSFELIRVLMLLVCGLTGREALTAAETIFELPSKDEVWGIQVFVPVAALSAERREAAHTLRQIYGAERYWIFFGALPLGVVGFVMARRIWRWIGNGAKSGLQDNWQAAAVLSGWTLLLGVAVAARTGELEDVAKITYKATLAKEHESVFLDCESAAKKGPVVKRDGSLMVCWEGFAAGSEKSARATLERMLALQEPRDQTVTRKRQAEWEGSLRKEIARQPKVAVFLRVQRWAEREKEINKITGQIEKAKTK